MIQLSKGGAHAPNGFAVCRLIRGRLWLVRWRDDDYVVLSTGSILLVPEGGGTW